MIVDDNLLIRTLLREIVGDGGHEVVAEAANGDEAIAHARKQRPDVVTLDLVMPKRDGLATLPELRRIDPAVLIIVCSAWLTAPRVTTALRLGAQGFVAKPFDRSTLLGVLDEVLREAGTHTRPSQITRSPAFSENEARDERREFDRAATMLPVVLQAGDATPTTTSTIDISGGGMLVRVAAAAPNEHVPLPANARARRPADRGYGAGRSRR